MNEHAGNSSQSTLGNAAIPDWMLKRRARLQASEAKSDSVTDRSEPVPMQPVEIITGPAPQAVEVAVQSTVPETVALLDDNSGAPENPFTTPADVPATSDPIFPVNFEPVVVPPKAKSGARTVKKAVFAPPVEKKDTPELPWYETLRERWLNKRALSSFAVSAGSHLLVAIALSLIVLHHQVTSSPSMIFSDPVGEGDGGGLIDNPLLEISPPGGQAAGELDEMLAANSVASALGPGSLEVSGFNGGVASGEDGDGGDGNGVGGQIGNGLNVGNGFQMPAGGKFVKKGSFTAWTVPEDPQPGEDYKIIIQVSYKNKNQKLTPDDITGSVIGTDKYRLMISRTTSEIIPDARQVVVYIPGAAARVRDTIRVYSATLRENQRLEITF